MELERVIIGRHRNPPKVTIPQLCKDAKTATLTMTGQLVLFRDYRREACLWVNEILPTLVEEVSGTEVVRKFWEAPRDAWFEFDYGKRTLYLCQLKKINP